MYLEATGDAVDMIREAQKRGVRVTAETCHHYLNLSAKEVPQGQTQFKCCPPIRGVPTDRYWKTSLKVSLFWSIMLITRIMVYNGHGHLIMATLGSLDFLVIFLRPCLDF